MKQSYLNTLTCAVVLILISITPVCAQDHAVSPQHGEQRERQIQVGPPVPSVAETVNAIFFDSAGHLWIGTLAQGVGHYNGKSLTYLTTKDGLCDNTITGIIEDREGNMWFATISGISIYDGKVFRNLGQKEGLKNTWVLCILQDRSGTIWASTVEGVFRYDGNSFTAFPLPQATKHNSRGVTSKKLVGHITEDRAGNIWFATNGAGAFRYDGKKLTGLTEEDGLACNFVNGILEDRAGNIWFTTDDKGVCRYDGKAFTTFTDNKTVFGDETWSIYEDSKGNIWFAPEGFGVYRYDGKSFTNLSKNNGLPIPAVRCITEDKKGRLWFGAGRCGGRSWISGPQIGLA